MKLKKNRLEKQKINQDRFGLTCKTCDPGNETVITIQKENKKNTKLSYTKSNIED
jgi:hypothetical protein